MPDETVADELRAVIVSARDCLHADKTDEAARLLAKALAIIDSSGWPMEHSK